MRVCNIVCWWECVLYVCIISSSIHCVIFIQTKWNDTSRRNLAARRLLRAYKFEMSNQRTRTKAQRAYINARTRWSTPRWGDPRRCETNKTCALSDHNQDDATTKLCERYTKSITAYDNTHTWKDARIYIRIWIRTARHVPVVCPRWIANVNWKSL